MGEEKNKKEIRPIMVVCGHCQYHDVQDNSLLEINFYEGYICYVCRKCNKENFIKMNAVPHSYPSIGIGR